MTIYIVLMKGSDPGLWIWYTASFDQAVAVALAEDIRQRSNGAAVARVIELPCKEIAPVVPGETP